LFDETISATSRQSHRRFIICASDFLDERPASLFWSEFDATAVVVAAREVTAAEGSRCSIIGRDLGSSSNSARAIAADAMALAVPAVMMVAVALAAVVLVVVVVAGAPMRVEETVDREEACDVLVREARARLEELSATAVLVFDVVLRNAFSALLRRKLSAWSGPLLAEIPHKSVNASAFADCNIDASSARCNPISSPLFVALSGDDVARVHDIDRLLSPVSAPNLIIK
jgi:hypothetical protein